MATWVELANSLGTHEKKMEKRHQHIFTKT